MRLQQFCSASAPVFDCLSRLSVDGFSDLLLRLLVSCRLSFCEVVNLPLLPANSSLVSYAGWIQVNEDYDSNLFYWLFEAQNAPVPADAPLLIWLNGGPGSSSMYGLFAENGPFYLSEDGSELIMRNTSWNDQYNIMFIDNPSVGRVARRDRPLRVDGQNAE
jgi:hypothetical protein